MRKYLQSFALLTVFVAFAAVAANAQVNYGAEVNIPFAFKVNEKSYEAGTYVVKVNRQIVGGAVLTIRQADSDEVQSVLMTEVGGTRTDDVRLVFRKENGVRQLSGVTSANSSYAFAGLRSTAPKG